MTNRHIEKLVVAVRDDIDDLVTWRPELALRKTNPFLIINHHGPQVYPANNRGLPFGPHPHRGFETVTFIVQGDLVHEDSIGFKSRIEAGGVQWMTAGSGLYHNEVVSEDFRRDGGTTEVLQLWVNLPQALKMTAPLYQGAQASDLPVIALDEAGSTMKLVAGTFAGHEGPIESLTGIFMTTIALAADGHVQLPVPSEREAFFYVMDGSVEIDGRNIGARTLIRFDRLGDTIEVRSEHGGSVIFGHADPIDEPIVMHGPFVMNDEAGVAQAIQDVRSGAIQPGRLAG